MVIYVEQKEGYQELYSAGAHLTEIKSLEGKVIKHIKILDGKVIFTLK